MTQSIETLARGIADRSGNKPTSDNWTRIYQAALAGMKLQRERDAVIADDFYDDTVRDSYLEASSDIAQAIRTQP